MKSLRRYYFTLLSFFFLTILSAQQVSFSPLPQSVKWGEKAFDNTAIFVLDTEQTADVDALNLLREKITIGTSGVTIHIGERGDESMKAYETLIPQKAEGYYLSITPQKVVVAGADGNGTFYGVQTLLQILKSSEVLQVSITDYPDVSERGVIEGYYGNPYSIRDRKSLFTFFGENKMNAYVYGPKDDPYHGFGNRWRDPYPPTQAVAMKDLVQFAHKNKVKFVWAVHPGNNISWDDNDGDGVVDDFKAAVAKFERMYQLGVRAFAVFFDDIGGIGADPTNQAKMMNYIDKEFVRKKHDVDPLILCPTQYNRSWSGGNYLNILGTKMDKSVRIMWTGNSVVDMINKSDMDWINGQISRKAYIWLNYPVTDYVVDRLLMGPTYGNDKNIASQLSGFLSNPMEYAEASKLSLFSIADYTWNMTAYNSNQSWIKGMHYLAPNSYDAFKIFCENNIDLGANFHGLRRKDESKEFAQVIKGFNTSYQEGKVVDQQVDAIKEKFQSFVEASDVLMADTYNPALIVEIKPWLEVFKIQGQKGLLLLQMYQNIANKDTVSFIENYQKELQLDQKQKSIRSRDFEGSIKKPNPKTANEVVAPFLKTFKGLLVKDYRSKYTYKKDIFPALILEDGNYYIKVNGKFLTNKNVNARGGNPTFENYKDSINPQRQEWTISLDPTTERYTIVNTQDKRYLNEYGNFGTNPYEAIWNTYTLYRFNGKYAIQNGGKSGQKFWNIENNRIGISQSEEATRDKYVFEIIPIGQENVTYAMIDPQETYYVKYGDGFLTNPLSTQKGEKPIFSPLKSEDKEQTQLWSILVDKSTQRFKLISVADNRYVNELGVFGTNPYFSTWNTYLVNEIGGLYSFRNAGEVKNHQYWGVENGKIFNSNLSRMESYIFEIRSKNEVTSVFSIVQPAQFQILLSKSTITVSGGDVSSLSLYALDGKRIAQNKNKHSISIPNSCQKGIYLLQITSTDGINETHKLAMN